MSFAALLLAISLTQPHRRVHYNIVDLSDHVVYRMTLILPGESGGADHYSFSVEDEFGRRYECEWEVHDGYNKGQIRSLSDGVIVESTTSAAGPANIAIFTGSKAYEYVSIDLGRSFEKSSDEARSVISKELLRFILDCHTRDDDPLHILFCGASCPSTTLRTIDAPDDKQ